MWPNIALPPSPSGINQFPDNPLPVEVFNRSIPDKFEKVKFENLNLKIEAQWEPVFSATAGPETPFSESVTVKTGASSTQKNTQQFSGSLGVTDFVNIGAALTETIGESVTISVSESISKKWGLYPKKISKTECMWQLCIKYTITGDWTLDVPFMPPVKESFTAILENRESKYVPTTYPASPTKIITDLK